MAEPKRGFTLIELLIVVAIIAILAAIAVPNFLEAQSRAKISRVKTDIRTISVALEAYAVDHNAYPILRGYLTAWPTSIDRGGIALAYDLTTPIAYLASVLLKDPFIPEIGYDQFGDVPNLQEAQGTVSRTISYLNITYFRTVNNRWGPCEVAWLLLSLGPDRKRGPIPGVTTTYFGTYAGTATRTPAQEQYFARAAYDPTNGSVSGGDIFMYQGRGF